MENVKLNLLKVVFDKRYKWEFYKHGVKISASIKDDSFLDRVASGEAFAKGDVLVTKLQTNQKFDSALNAFINKSYEVLEVLNHIPRSKQMKLEIYNVSSVNQTPARE